MLHVLLTVADEVAHLGVGVLQRTAHLGQVVQRLLPDVAPLRERRRLVVTALLHHRVQRLCRAEQVVLELTESLHGRPGVAGQRLLGLLQDVLRGAGQRVAVHVVERAQQVERGGVAERVDERRPEPWHHVQVGRGGLDEAEQAGSVDPLPHREHPIQLRPGLDDEVQHLQPTVTAQVAKVQHPDVVGLDVGHDVGLGELLRRLVERADELVRVQGYGVGLEHVILLGGCGSVFHAARAPREQVRIGKTAHPQPDRRRRGLLRPRPPEKVAP